MNPVAPTYSNNSAQVRLHRVTVQFSTKPTWLGGEPFVALDDMDLVIESQNVAIVGPSGAGKTTLIELLFGLRQPSKGSITVCEYSLNRLTSEQRKHLCQHIQLIPQEPQSTLNPYYSVRQVLREPLLNIGLMANADEKINQAMLDVGLDPCLLNRQTQQLSLGQAQRIAIARALIVEPCVLVADEPTSSLDPISRKQILELFAQLQKSRRMRLILVTHDLSAAHYLCEQLVVLNGGRIVEQGELEQIIVSPSHPTTKALLDASTLQTPLTHSY
jgi:peptide/nickel transport system ATP-binding protein